MNATTEPQFCNIHHSFHDSDSLLDRVWNRFSHSVNKDVIMDNPELQEKILREQKQAEIQNLTKRTNDVVRMVMRYTF